MKPRRELNIIEPVPEKTNNLEFRPAQTQTALYSHSSRLDSLILGFTKRRNCTICVAKTNALISFAVVSRSWSARLFSPMHIVGFLMQRPH